MNELTYPISPDYVRSWTADRAIAELIANALDEDPNARAVWADGILVIEDDGPGIPEEGMILGYSPKRDNDEEIGQFGEGAKIASLVLARSEDIGQVRVETVGYGFVPTVQTRRILDGVAPRASQRPPQVLVYTFTESSRTRGTRITIECAQDVAASAIGRFRHLTEPGYQRPTDSAQILLGGQPGRLFIGGVMVSTLPRMLASYDFPLAAAKSAQNRDRTVIDSAVLTDLVTDALAASADPEVIRAFAEHCLAGRRLSEPEKYFTKVDDPIVRAAFAAVGRAMFADRAVFYISHGVDESALDLLDGDYELLTTNLDMGSHAALMRLLGVEQARTVARTRPDHRKRTKYVDLRKLTPAQRDNLEQAVAATRAVFGPSAVGDVKVFSDTGDRYLACAAGFYEPRTGGIAVRQDVLDDYVNTLETVVHESAHRRAHTDGREFSDRTRGFEEELTKMLALTVAHLTRASGDACAAPTLAGPVVTEEVEVIPPARADLAALLHDALPLAFERFGVDHEGALSDRLALHRNYLRMLLNPRRQGWRRKASAMGPSVVANPRILQVIADATGIRMSALWLGHMLCEGPRYGQSRDAATTGPWSGRLTKSLDPVLAELDSLGGVYAAAAADVRALAAGDRDIDPEQFDWQEPARAVLAAERERLNLPHGSTVTAAT